MLNQNGRKIFNFYIFDQMSLIFYVYPGKAFIGMAGDQFFECFAIDIAGIAPGGAKAGYQPVFIVQLSFQLFQIIGLNMCVHSVILTDSMSIEIQHGTEVITVKYGYDNDFSNRNLYRTRVSSVAC